MSGLYRILGVMRNLALLGVVAVVGLAGCAAPAPAAPKVDQEAIYITAWQSRFPTGDTAAAVRVGKGICDDYEAGTSFRDEVAYLMTLSDTMTAGDAGFMIGNATSSFCPKYINRH